MSAVEIVVPDIGDTEEAEVVEILVAPGDSVAAEDPLVSIESDKATLEVPSPQAGVVEAVRVKVGDRVSEGSALVVLEPATGGAEPARPPAAQPQEGSGADSEAGSDADPQVEAKAGTEAPTADDSAAAAAGAAQEAAAAATSSSEARSAGDTAGIAPRRPPPVPPAPPAGERPHASPLVRREARELGVDLGATPGLGEHGRIRPEDLRAHVRRVMSGQGSRAGAGGLAGASPEELAEHGTVREAPWSEGRRAAAARAQESWQQAPLTQLREEARIDALEAFRAAHQAESLERGAPLGLLPFVMKACARALRSQPELRRTLGPEGQSLLERDACHLAVAIEAEGALFLPVVRDVDRKGVLALAAELADWERRARAGELDEADLEGACLRITSPEGGAGRDASAWVEPPEAVGMAFSRPERRPVWDPEAGEEGGFVPRLVLSFSLATDRRVVDPAAAGRFAARVAEGLSRLSTLLL